MKTMKEGFSMELGRISTAMVTPFSSTGAIDFDKDSDTNRTSYCEWNRFISRLRNNR